MASSFSTFVLLFLIGWDSGRAQQDGETDTVGNPSVVDGATASNWLAAHGWTPSDGSASEFIDLASYMRNFQRYTGLPITGKLDKATMDKMNSPRCGNPDFGPEGFTSTASRARRWTPLGNPWPQNHVTWYLDGITNDLSEPVILKEIEAAFELWEDQSALTFERVFTRNADILVDFTRGNHGDGSSFDGPGMTLAHAFAPGGGIGGDMHFDDDERFTTTNNHINLRQVAVHEIGHSLGLGHSSDNNAIMAPFYSYRTNLRLGSDDILGIRSLYGGPRNTATRPPMKTEAPTKPTVTTVTPTRTLNPVFCNGEFDATSESFDDAIYLFQGKQVFKVRPDQDGAIQIEPNYPRRISAELPGAPNFVDAAFLWKVSSRSRYLFVFKGYQYWRYYNGRASSGYPRPISEWGLPGNIDGAFRWPANQRIYFFKGNQYYRYNSMTYSIDNGYPRSTGVWSGIRSPVGAVLDYGSQTFFFKGQYFQEYITDSRSASANHQTALIWLGCQTEGLREFGVTTEMPTTEELTTMSGVDGSMPCIFVVMVTSFLSALVSLST